jgi:4-hydroxy-tetrahydrodipicolinate synthase
VKLEGVYSVLPTAFTEAGDLDDASLRRVVDLFIGAGVNGVTALGVTGEVARLDDAERRRVLEVVTSHVAGRIGVVAGTTAEGTRTCLNYSRHAKESGATAVMVSPPRMPKLNSDAVLRHFHALAEAVDIEIVVQDYPPISGYAM